MKINIDQSGKIEQTAVDSIIAYANGTQKSVCIPRKLKRQIQEVFREHGLTSLFIYFLFATSIHYLLENITAQTSITIDTEYPGKDRLILSFITSFHKNNSVVKNIQFARIGNKPKAHYATKDVYDKKLKPDRIITMTDVIEVLKKTDGRLRECLSTLVDAQARSSRKSLSKKR